MVAMLSAVLGTLGRCFYYSGTISNLFQHLGALGNDLVWLGAGLTEVSVTLCLTWRLLRAWVFKIGTMVCGVT